jgi:hypothetical protein
LSDGKQIRTATMARILAQQGHHREAAEIYRYLLQQDPSRSDLAQALDALEHAKPEPPAREPGALLAQWIEMLLRYRRLRDLKDIKARLQRLRRQR